MGEGIPTVKRPNEMVPTNLEMKIVGRDILRSERVESDSHLTADRDAL